MNTRLMTLMTAAPAVALQAVLATLALTTRDLALVIAAAAAAPVLTLVTVQNVRAYRSAMAGSRTQAYTDELTGIANRRNLYETLGSVLTSAGQDDRPASLLYLDLDGFKDLNDALGHSAGDLLLKLVAARLKSSLRDGDTLARLGGDEFAVLLPGADENAALEVVGRVQTALQGAFPVAGLAVHVETSIGVAVFPLHGHNVETLIQHADIAMYQAKKARTGFELYRPERDAADRMQLGLLGEMRRAVEEDELVLHYQPQVDLRTGEVVGVEALVRWRHPVRGLLMPADFLPMAEQTGLMRALTTWVLDRALEQWARWKAGGRDLPIAVNLSVPNVLDTNLPAEVAGLLAKYDAPASRLQLEITENVVMADPARVATVLDQLKALGVRLALDDFGTGRSSLAYLKTLPLDELKIDKSFVCDVTTDAQDAAIVQSTAELGRRLGLQVLAEGMETAGAWDQLAGFGCERAQGFHLSEPLPASDLNAWLERWSAKDRRSPAGSATLNYRGSTMAVGGPGEAPTRPAARKNPRARITYRGTELGGS